MSMRRLLLTLVLTLPAFSAYAQTPIYCLNNGVLAPCSASNPLQVSGNGGGGGSPYQYTPLTAPSTPQTISTTSAGLTSIPTGAIEAYLYNSGAVTILYRWDGVALTSTNGIGFPAQATLVIQGSALISALQMATASGTSTLTVQYTK